MSHFILIPWSWFRVGIPAESFIRRGRLGSAYSPTRKAPARGLRRREPRSLPPVCRLSCAGLHHDFTCISVILTTAPPGGRALVGHVRAQLKRRQVQRLLGWGSAQTRSCGWPGFLASGSRGAPSPPALLKGTPPFCSASAYWVPPRPVGPGLETENAAVNKVQYSRAHCPGGSALDGGTRLTRNQRTVRGLVVMGPEQNMSGNVIESDGGEDASLNR